MQTIRNIEMLPHEIFKNICKYLSKKDIISLIKSSKQIAIAYLEYNNILSLDNIANVQYLKILRKNKRIINSDYSHFLVNINDNLSIERKLPLNTSPKFNWF